MTMAHIYASKGIIPPKIWQHDPTIYELKGKNTVAMLLAKQLGV